MSFYKKRRTNSSDAFQRYEGHFCSVLESLLRMWCLFRKPATKIHGKRMMSTMKQNYLEFCDLPRYTSEKTHHQGLDVVNSGHCWDSCGAWSVAGCPMLAVNLRPPWNLTLAIEGPYHGLVPFHLHSDFIQFHPTIFSIRNEKRSICGFVVVQDNEFV